MNLSTNMPARTTGAGSGAGTGGGQAILSAAAAAAAAHQAFFQGPAQQTQNQQQQQSQNQSLPGKNLSVHNLNVYSSSSSPVLKTGIQNLGRYCYCCKFDSILYLWFHYIYV